MLKNSLNYFIYIYIYIMSEWLAYVKAYAAKNNITYNQALKDTSPSLWHHIKQEMKKT